MSDFLPVMDLVWDATSSFGAASIARRASSADMGIHAPSLSLLLMSPCAQLFCSSVPVLCSWRPHHRRQRWTPPQWSATHGLLTGGTRWKGGFLTGVRAPHGRAAFFALPKQLRSAMREAESLPRLGGCHRQWALVSCVHEREIFRVCFPGSGQLMGCGGGERAVVIRRTTHCSMSSSVQGGGRQPSLLCVTGYPRTCVADILALRQFLAHRWSGSTTGFDET